MSSCFVSVTFSVFSRCCCSYTLLLNGEDMHLHDQCSAPHPTPPHHTTPHHTTPHHTTPHHIYVVWCRLTRLSEGQQGRVLLHPSCQSCWRQRGPQKVGPVHWRIARTQVASYLQVNPYQWGIMPRYGMPLCRACIQVQAAKSAAQFCSAAIACNALRPELSDK